MPPIVAIVCLAIVQAVAGARSSQQATPERIVSLIPATTEMLFAMGAGGRVAGVSAYDRYPAEVSRLPRVGGLLDPSVEAILALRPDLAIVYATQVELRTQLERARIPMFLYTHKGVPDIMETMRALGARIGEAAPADAAASRLERQLAAVSARVAGRKRPRVLLVFGREPGTLRQVQASAGYGFLHDVLEIAGGEDVLSHLARQSVQLNTETIITLAPEVIIELRYGEALPAGRLEAERRVWDALASVPAVRQKRVHLLVGDEFVVPGPRIGLAAERFAQVLHR